MISGSREDPAHKVPREKSHVVPDRLDVLVGAVSGDRCSENLPWLHSLGTFVLRLVYMLTCVLGDSAISWG